MKATRKLIPALALLIVSAVVMSTASYAWFTMSREVTATDMNVTVTAPNNLLIAGANDNTYQNFSAVGTDASAAVSLVPASSVDGLNIFKMDSTSTEAGALSVNANGSLMSNTVLVQDTTGGNGNGYVDFRFDLKTDNTAADVNVYVKSVTATSDNGKTAKPVRIAIIDDPTGTPSCEGVITPNTTANFETGKAIKSIQADGKVLAADKDTVTAVTVDGGTTKTPVFTVEMNGVVKQIAVRVWFEGEDTECTSALAAAADLDISMVLADAAA